jgi:hypothetical protein
MTIPRGLFILLVGMLLGALLAVCIILTALTHQEGWAMGIVFTGLAVWAFICWIAITE